MMIKKFVIPLFSLAAFVLAVSVVLAVPGTWAGYAHINNAVAANGTPVSAVINNASALAANTSIRGPEYSPDVSQGYYILQVEGADEDKVNFRICGVNVSIPSESWSVGPHYNGTTPNFNLSISTLANGAACTYACGCTGGYCNSGTCASSAVTTTTAAPSGGVGGGSGGGATTTVTVATTTTTTPPVKESETVSSIPAGTTGNFSFETTPITEINVEVKNAVTNAQITVTKTDTAPSTVSIAAPGNVYAYFNIEKINLADANVNKITINFKVEKSWITNNNIDVNTITMNRYVNGAWTPITTKLVSSNGYYYFEAESPGLSVFAVTAQKVVTTTAPTTVPVTTTTVPIVIKPGDYTWILVLIIIIIIAFVIWKYYKKIRKKAQAAISEVVPQQ